MNYMLLGKRFHLHYAYIDTENYLADSLLNKNDVSVIYGQEYGKEGEKYVILFCKVKRSQKARFERSMLELRNKMLLCGHNDYEEFCKEIFRGMRDEE